MNNNQEKYVDVYKPKFKRVDLDLFNAVIIWHYVLKIIIHEIKGLKTMGDLMILK